MSHIKLHGVKPRIQYVANGTLKEYEFPFVIFAKTNIKVYLDDVEQNETTYTVSGIKNSNGGCITFNTAPENNVIISIVRDLSIERTTDFQEGATLRANELNDELDYQMACLQQVAENLNRSMVLPPYAADSTLDLTLPTPSAGKAIVWNASGTNLENSAVAVNALESTLKDYKNTAEQAATLASSNAAICSDNANIAIIQANIASAKAQEAITTLSDKVNQDMGNLSSEGKKILCTLGLPSNNYIDIPEPANGSANNYTAPANGYIYYGRRKTGSDSGVIYIVNLANHIELNAANYLGDTVCTVLMPVRKNDACVLGRKELTGQLIGCRFYYAMGELS